MPNRLLANAREAKRGGKKFVRTRRRLHETVATQRLACELDSATEA